MAGDTETKDYLGMSDDDFLNAPIPAPAPAGENEPEAASDAAVVEEPQVEAEVKVEAEVDGGAVETDEDDVAAEDDKSKSEDEPEVHGSGEAEKPAEQKANDKPKDEAKPDAEKAKTEAEPEKKVNYEDFFKKVMAPFKANGREIKLETPDEAIRLMQMGAGYGRKLQDLQPALKTLRMLEKNDLLDEGKLSFLIDINNKNPDAIKKLIADSGIDPLDLNIGDNVSYTPTNRSVSDKEMVFQDTLKDIESHEGGQETIRIVNQTWDKESKSALWDQPQLLTIIQSQRENGVYDQIVAEMDRQKLLGTIPNNAPFLQAYKLAGDKLFPQAPVQTQSGDTPQPQVIATRTAAPKAQVQNGDKAAAAASTKSSTRKAGVTVNPLEMADDDFLKQFEGRL